MTFSLETYTGYVKTTISKTLLANGENLQVYMDEKKLYYSVASGIDSWVVELYYSHSAHQIKIHVYTNVSSAPPLGDEAILIVIVALFSVILTIETLHWLGRDKKVVKNALV